MLCYSPCILMKYALTCLVLAAANEKFRRQMLGLYMPSICLYRTPYSDLPWHLKFSQVYAKGLASRSNRSVRSYALSTNSDQPNEQVEHFHLELSTSHSGVPMSGITWAIWLVKTPDFGLDENQVLTEGLSPRFH
jgi:hypothetical protein